MTNVRVLPPFIADAPRTVTGLSICPACKFCADHGIHPHLCITTGDTPQIHLQWLAHPAAFPQLLLDLATHPAQPLVWAGDHNEIPTLRQVDRSWCACAHAATSPVAGAGGARS